MSQRCCSSPEHPTSLSRRSPTRRRTLFEDLLGRPPEEEAQRVLASLRRGSVSLPADQVSGATELSQPRQTSELSLDVAGPDRPPTGSKVTTAVRNIHCPSMPVPMTLPMPNRLICLTGQPRHPCHGARRPRRLPGDHRARHPDLY